MKNGRKNGPNSNLTPQTIRKSVGGVLPDGRAELRSIIENMDGAFYRNDDDGRILMVSAGVQDLLGYAPEDLIGRNAAELYAEPDGRADFLKALHDAGGMVRGYRSVMRHRDGHLVYLSNSAHVFPMPGRDRPGIEGVVRDVTCEHLAQAALAKQKDRHLRLVEGLPDGVLIVTAGEIRFANRSAADLLGGGQEGLPVGRQFLDFFESDRREFVEAWLGRAMAAVGDVDPGDTVFRLHGEPMLDADGNGLCADLYAHPMTDPEGNGSLQVVIRDITARKAEEALLHLADRVFRDSPDIIAVISRDFRYRTVNGAYTDFYGVPEDQIVGRLVATFMGHDKFDAIVRPRMELCLAGQQIQYEDWFLSPMRGQRYLHVAYTPLESVRGRIDGLIVISRDITERKQAEDRVQDLNNELELRVKTRTLTLEAEISQRKDMENRLRESEERFRAITETASAAIFISDPDTGQIFYVNPAAGRLFGYAQDDLMRVNGIDLYADPSDRRRTLEAVSVGGRHIGQEEYRRKDGTTFWGMRSVSRDIINGRDTLVTVLADISDLKETEQALRQSEARFRDIVETASNWFWEMDADFRYTVAPSQFYQDSGVRPEDYLGKTREELVGVDIDALPEPERKRWLALQADMENHRPFQNFQYEFTQPDGAIRVYQVNGKPFFGADGTFMGYRGSTSDITERSRAENAVRASRDAAERAAQAKSDFLAAMSHELRTPLNAIIGFSEIMTKQLLGPIENDAYLDYAHNIQDSGERLLAVINDILDLSALESGGVALREDAVYPEQVVDGLFAELNDNAVKAGVTLTMALPDDLPAVMGDERRIAQALRCLLLNAIKFTPHGGRVTLTGALDGDGTLRLQVSDTGIGMTAEEIEKAIEAFAQADSALARKYEGAGLGLSIAKRLIEAHDGGLQIESTLGKGTVVTLFFPKDRVLLP